MRQLRRNRQLAIFLLLCSFFFSACHGFNGRISKQAVCIKTDDIEAFLLTLKNQNVDLKTFKGVGKVTLYRDGKKNLPNRIAWVGASPDKFRAVLSSASGRPFLSFASDGQWFFVFDHLQGQFNKRRTNHYIVKNFFSVSIELADIVSMLSGRVPVRRHRSACLLKDNDSHQGLPTRLQPVSSEESRGGEDENILVLKGVWGNIYEKIFLDNSKNDVRKIEAFDLGGVLAYRAELSAWQNVNGYRIPATVVVSSDEGSGFRLDVERYWPNVHVAPSIFELSPPPP